MLYVLICSYIIICYLPVNIVYHNPSTVLLNFGLEFCCQCLRHCLVTDPAARHRPTHPRAPEHRPPPASCVASSPEKNNVLGQSLSFLNPWLHLLNSKSGLSHIILLAFSLLHMFSIISRDFPMFVLPFISFQIFSHLFLAFLWRKILHPLLPLNPCLTRLEFVRWNGTLKRRKRWKKIRSNCSNSECVAPGWKPWRMQADPQPQRLPHVGSHRPSNLEFLGLPWINTCKSDNTSPELGFAAGGELLSLGLQQAGFHLDKRKRKDEQQKQELQHQVCLEHLNHVQTPNGNS